jgi:hypothetical protein
MQSLDSDSEIALLEIRAVNCFLKFLVTISLTRSTPIRGL